MSNTWMLWSDGEKRKSPDLILAEAMEYYQRKYGVRPDRAQVPLDFPVVSVEEVRIEHRRNVTKGHLFLACTDDISQKRKKTKQT